MSTVSKKIADAIVKGNGFYPGDHIRVQKIVEYDNAFGGDPAYGLIYQGQDLDRYRETQFVRNPRVYWEWKGVK